MNKYRHELKSWGHLRSELLERSRGTDRSSFSASEAEVYEILQRAIPLLEPIRMSGDINRRVWVDNFTPQVEDPDAKELRLLQYYRGKKWVSESRRIHRSPVYEMREIFQVLLVYALRVARSTTPPLDVFGSLKVDQVIGLEMDQCLTYLERIGGTEESVLVEPTHVLRVNILASDDGPETESSLRAVVAMLRETFAADDSAISFSYYEREAFGEEDLTLGDPDHDWLAPDIAGPALAVQDIETYLTRLTNTRRGMRQEERGMVFALSGGEHEWNYFAHSASSDPTAWVGFLHEFEKDYGVSNPVGIAACLTIGIAAAALHHGGGDIFELYHQESRGCLMDFCADKRDIRKKVLSADICSDCLETLEKRVSRRFLKDLRTLLERMRAETMALPSAVGDLGAIPTLDPTNLFPLRREFPPLVTDGDYLEQLRQEVLVATILINSITESAPISLPEKGVELKDWIIGEAVNEGLGIEEEGEWILSDVAKGKKATNLQHKAEVLRGRLTEIIQAALSSGGGGTKNSIIFVSDIDYNDGRFFVVGTVATLFGMRRWSEVLDSDPKELGLPKSGGSYLRVEDEVNKKLRFHSIANGIGYDAGQDPARLLLDLPIGKPVDLISG